MPARRTYSAQSVPQLIRTKTGTGDDTIYADGATTPSSDTYSMPAFGPMNRAKGHNSEVELYVVAVNAAGTALARGTCTFDLRAIHILERQFAADPDDTWPDVACAVEPLTGQALQSAIRIPWCGGAIWVGFENIANAPVGTTDFQVWAVPVAG